MPGVDLSMPMVYMVGLKGNSALLAGGDQGAGSYSVGLTAQIRSQYTVALASKHSLPDAPLSLTLVAVSCGAEPVATVGSATPTVVNVLS